MISAFDVTKLQELLRDFYLISGIRASVMDENFRELAAYPRELPSFCALIRTDESACAACRRSDRQGCLTAAKTHGLYTYVCHAGLTESIAPLFHENVVIGYLLFGHVFCYPDRDAGVARIARRCRDYQVDEKALARAAAALPVVREGYIEAASHILCAVAAYLCRERMAVLRQTRLPAQIDAYLQENFTRPVTAESLCARFKVGRTKLYEIFRQNYGVGVAEQVRALRVRCACGLLARETDMPVSEIAARCGYEDADYFITLFHRETGLTPRAYRARELAVRQADESLPARA